MDSSAAPIHYSIIRENWLTRRLDKRAATLALLATLGLIFGALVSWDQSLGASAWMSASAAQVFVDHQWWRLWTTLFVHGDLRHLLSNAFMFYILGVFLIGYFGAWVFLVLAIFSGGLVNLLVLRTMPALTQLIGMSGVVFWMGGFWLTLYLLIDRRRSVTQRLLRVGGAALGLYMPAEAFDPSISYFSHLWGFILGFVFAVIYFALNRPRFLLAEVHEEVFED